MMKLPLRTSTFSSISPSLLKGQILLAFLCLILTQQIGHTQCAKSLGNAQVLCYSPNGNGSTTVFLAEGNNIVQKVLDKNGATLSSTSAGTLTKDSVLVRNNQVIKKLVNGTIAYTKTIPPSVLSRVPSINAAVEMTDGTFVLGGYQKIIDPVFSPNNKDSLVLITTDANLNFQNSIVHARSSGPYTPQLDALLQLIPLPNNQFLATYYLGFVGIINRASFNFSTFQKTGANLAVIKSGAYGYREQNQPIITSVCGKNMILHGDISTYGQKGSFRGVGDAFFNIDSLFPVISKTFGEGSVDYYGPYRTYSYFYKPLLRDTAFQLSVNAYGDPRISMNNFTQLEVKFYDNNNTPNHAKIIPFVAFDHVIRTGDTTCLVLMTENGQLKVYNPDCNNVQNLPDLTLANVNITTPSVQQGQILNYKVDIKNIGTAAATANFTVKAYISKDTILSADDVQDGIIPTGNFAAGLVQTQVVGASTVVPTVSAGQYYLILKVDADGQIAEGNETNNVLVSTSTFTVTAVQTGSYCASKGTAPWELWTRNVSFNTLNNTSEKFKDYATLGFSNYTNLSTTVNKGQTYPLSILPPTGWNGYFTNVFCRVWIDFNKNNVFEDNEKVLEGTNANLFTTNVLIPTNAATGSVRMRVSMKWGSYPTACETFEKGEVEDYMVNITGGGTNTCTSCGFIKNYAEYPVGSTTSLGFTSEATANNNTIVWTLTNPLNNGTANRIVTLTTDLNGVQANFKDETITNPVAPYKVTATVTATNQIEIKKTLANGTVEWTKTYPFSGSNANVLQISGGGVYEVSDGFILHGSVVYGPAPNVIFSYWTMKVLQNGNFVVQNNWGALTDIEYLSISFKSVAGGYIGTFYRQNYLELLKFDNNGALLWKSFLASDLPSTYLKNLRENADGTAIFAAIINNLRAEIRKYNGTTGVNIWTKYPSEVLSPNEPFTSYESFRDVIPTTDGGAIVGYTFSTPGGGTNGYEYGRLDANGNQVWYKRLNNQYDLEPKAAIGNCGFLFVGRKNADLTMMRITNEGDTLPTCGGVIPSNLPDLTVTFSSAYQCGGTHACTDGFSGINVRIKNQGTAAAASTSLKFYQSADETFDASDTPLLIGSKSNPNPQCGGLPYGTEILIPNLAAGASLDTFIYAGQPSNVYWIAKTDANNAISENNENNNTFAQCYKPSLNSITTAVGQDTFRTNLATANQLQISYLAAINPYCLSGANYIGLTNNQLAYYLSTDTVISANDIVVPFTLTGMLNFGIHQTEVIVPNTVASGVYYLIAKATVQDVCGSSPNTRATFRRVIVVNSSVTNTNDIALSLTSTPSVFTKYTPLNFTVSAKNTGNQVFTNVKIEFKFPIGTTNGGAATPSFGTWQEWCAGGTQCFTWTIPTLAANANATLNVPVYVLNPTSPMVATAKLLVSTPVDNVVANNIATISLNTAPPPARSIQAQPTQLIPIVVDKISPSPSDGEVTIELESLDSREVRFDFSDAFGKTVKTEIRKVEKGTNRVLFEVFDLPQGIYFVSPSTNKGKNVPTKFVKI